MAKQPTKADIVKELDQIKTMLDGNNGITLKTITVAVFILMSIPFISTVGGLIQYYGLASTTTGEIQ
jgi:hypothetical protein